MDQETTTSTESVETPLSDIALFKSGSGTAAPTGEVAATPAVDDTGRDEAGRFKAKETAAEVKTEARAEVKTEAVATDKPVEAKPTGQLAALMAERAKRQELERRLAALESGKPAENPDIFTEPEKAVQALVEKHVAPIKERFFMQSLELAQSKHADDWDAAVENATNLLDANPALEQELRAARDPGEFIYLIGSNTPEFRQAREGAHRDVVTAKDAEITALKAELATLKNTQKSISEVPESLNRQPSGAVPARDGDATDISKIVRFKSG